MWELLKLLKILTIPFVKSAFIPILICFLLHNLAVYRSIIFMIPSYLISYPDLTRACTVLKCLTVGDLGTRLPLIIILLFQKFPIPHGGQIL